MLQIFSDPHAMHFYPSTKDEAETERWVRWTLRNYETHGYGLWIFELKDGCRFVGQAGVVPQIVAGEEEAEIGYLFVRDHWGKGYATEAANGCKEYAMRTFGLHRFVSIIHPENRRSIRVALRLGMSWEKTVEFHGREHLLYALSC